jgi:hypothetical protein
MPGLLDELLEFGHRWVSRMGNRRAEINVYSFATIIG